MHKIRLPEQKISKLVEINIKKAMPNKINLSEVALNENKKQRPGYSLIMTLIHLQTFKMVNLDFLT